MRNLKYVTPEEARHYVTVERDDPFRWSKSIAYTLVPTKNPDLAKQGGWEDFVYLGHGVTDPTYSTQPSEWVYVLVNKSVPGICKVGMTATSVRQRVAEINSATGVITPWIPVYRFECINALALEQAVHRELEMLGYRVNPNREGFEIPSEVAVQTIERLGDLLTVGPRQFQPKPAEL
jgi:hypothetical protein